MTIGRVLLIWFVIAVIVVIGLIASGILTIRISIVKKKGQKKPDSKIEDDDDDDENELKY